VDEEITDVEGEGVDNIRTEDVTRDWFGGCLDGGVGDGVGGVVGVNEGEGEAEGEGEFEGEDAEHDWNTVFVGIRCVLKTFKTTGTCIVFVCTS